MGHKDRSRHKDRNITEDRGRDRDKHTGRHTTRQADKQHSFEWSSDRAIHQFAGNAQCSQLCSVISRAQVCALNAGVHANAITVDSAVASQL